MVIVETTTSVDKGEEKAKIRLYSKYIGEEFPGIPFISLATAKTSKF